MRILVASALVIALATACGAGPPPFRQEPISHELLLEVERIGQLPVAVYADGRVFTPAPQIAIYPAPALPAFNVSRVPPEQPAEILMRVQALGVLDANSGSPAAVVTAVIDGEPRVTRLGTEDAAKIDAVLADLPVSSADSLYEPKAIAVFAGPPAEAVEGIEPETRDWPLGDLPTGCSVIRGSDLPSALAAAQQANQLTRWRSGAETYGLVFRPLLPHETSCDDVFAPTS